MNTQDVAQMNCEQLCQLMLDIGRQQLGNKFDNKHQTYREIYAAFRANDLEEAKRIYATNYS